MTELLQRILPYLRGGKSFSALTLGKPDTPLSRKQFAFSVAIELDESIKIPQDKLCLMCWAEKPWKVFREWIAEAYAKQTKEKLDAAIEEAAGMLPANLFTAEEAKTIATNILPKYKQIVLPEEHYLQTVCDCKVFLNMGDGDESFWKNCIYPHPGVTREYKLAKKSSITVLGTASGYKLKQLRASCLERVDDPFLSSLYDELANCHYSAPTVTFLTQLSLRNLLDIGVVKARESADLLDKRGEHQRYGFITMDAKTPTGLVDIVSVLESEASNAKRDSSFGIKLPKDVKINLRDISLIAPKVAEIWEHPNGIYFTPAKDVSLNQCKLVSIS